MSTFSTEIPWQAPGYLRLPYTLSDYAQVGLQWRTAAAGGSFYAPPYEAQGAEVPLYAYASLPWNVSVGGYTDVGPYPARTTDDAEQYISQLQAQQSAAQTALATAHTQLALARAALATAIVTTQQAQRDCDAAQAVYLAAQVDLAIATRRNNPDAIAAAQTSLLAADAQRLSLSQPLADATDAQAEAALLVTNWQNRAQAAAADLAPIQNVTLPVAQLNLGFVNTGALDAGATRAQFTANPAQGSNTVALSSGGGVDEIVLDGTVYQCVVGTSFYVVISVGEYRIGVPIPDDVYQAVQGLECQVVFVWTEVTEVKGWVCTTAPPYAAVVQPDPNVTHYCPSVDSWTPAPDPAEVSFVSKTETLDVSDAVYDEGSGDWLLYTSAQTLTPPDPGDPGIGQPPDVTTLSVQGAPVLPISEAQIQVLGAESYRQGFYENTTADDAPTARRYLKLTASTGPGAPAGIHYGGSIEYAAAPPDVLDGTYLSTPTDYWDVPDRSLPLTRHYTLSTDAAAAYNTLFAKRVTDQNRVLTPTVRTLATPPGLILTLSEEVTTGDLQGDVAALVNVGWPDLDPATGEYPATASLSFAGAINAVPDTGNYCGQQKMRYRLEHSAQDSRHDHDNTFTTTHHWELHTRDLLTGAVTVAAHSTTITWPNVVTTTDTDGNTTTQYLYTKTDAAWTEVAVPDENKSVTLVLLPGETDQPQTFGGIVATLEKAPQGVDGPG